MTIGTFKQVLATVSGGGQLQAIWTPVEDLSVTYSTTFSHPGTLTGTPYTITHNLGTTSHDIKVSFDTAGANGIINLTPFFSFISGLTTIGNGYTISNIASNSFVITLYQFIPAGLATALGTYNVTVSVRKI